MGQASYDFGVKSENAHAPFLRLPVPKNPKPLPVTYTLVRRGLESIHHDLETCEKTLSGITDDRVTLPLRLVPVRFDFKNSGNANDSFKDILTTILQRRDLDFLKGNSDLLVKFDRGDVAWLRAYCHLLMGLLDLLLAFDLEDEFDRQAGEIFAEPVRRKTDEPKKLDRLMVKEPVRLGQFRKHLLEVARLNRETWRFILAETDDDHEWLPNPKQKGVLGLPVTGEQIEAWLAMMNELEGLLEGKKVISQSLLRLLWPSIEGGLNVKTLLDDPPPAFDFQKLMVSGPAAKYLDKNGGDFNTDALMRTIRLFDNPMGLGYMAWFN
jgi:hypothetical protein